ncbi:MAG: SpoIIE family protein phosphatase [Snowella sp.]|nr:SpoIIE family protein phosphatase [Snowella sp.]
MKTQPYQNQWFRPVIHLINQLRYPQKFGLISCVFLMPLTLALYLLLSEIQGQINFAKLEIDGLEYLQALRHFKQEILAVQFPQTLNSASISARDPSRLAESWRSLQTIDQNYRHALKTPDQFARLSQTFTSCQAQSCWQNVARSPLFFPQIHQQIQDLWQQIGDQSNLILDPDLDSYYLMDVVVLKLPSIQRDLMAILKITQFLSEKQPLSEFEKTQLTILNESLSQTHQELVKSLTIAFNNNPSGNLRSRLTPPRATLSQQFDQLTNSLQNSDVGLINQQSLDTLQASFSLWDKTSDHLAILLQQRIQRFVWRQWLLGSFVLFTLAIALYLFIGFYLSVMQMVASLRAASERMISGKQQGDISLNSRDEMTEVITAFNTVADALRTAEFKYRSIFENAVEGIYQTTLEGNYLIANPMLARLYGYESPSEMLAELKDIEHQLYVERDRRQEFIKLMEKDGKVWGFESEIYRKDGSKLWITESARAIYSPEGKITGFEGTVVDITQRKADELEIHRLTQQLQDENLRMSAELDVTRHIQQMLMPSDNELNSVESLDIAGFMEPAAEVGGDYYDILQENGKVRISIGDVTGHGLESSIVMIMAQTAVRTLIANGETDPARLLNAVNQTIYANTRRMGSYKNMSLLLLEYEAGLIRLSGQHEELIIVRQSGEVEQIDTLELGFPLGLESNITQFVSEQQIQLYSGDVALLYTDGITEAMNPENQQYGLAQLCQVIVENRDRSAQEIRQAIIDNLKQYIQTQKVFDDITLLVLKQQ